MGETLLVAGLACVIAAIVGGGLKAFGLEIPALRSRARQAALGALGLVLLIGAAVVEQGLASSSGAGDRVEPALDQDRVSVDPSAEPSTRPSSPEEPPAQMPPSDFPGGSVPAFSADFASWPRPASEHGSISLGFGNSLVLEPSTNVWIGTRQDVGVANLSGDFVCDARFRIEERNPSATLQLALTGAGQDAVRVELYLSVWRDENVTYSLNKSRVRSGGGLAVPHVVLEEQVAERTALPPAIREHDWSSGSELTFKRDGGTMQFFVNDRFVEAFDVPRFPVREVSTGAAGESRIVVTSIECRTPPGSADRE